MVAFFHIGYVGLLESTSLGPQNCWCFFMGLSIFGGTPEDICEPQLNSDDFKQLYCELVVHGDYLHMVGHLSMATLRENPAKS